MDSIDREEIAAAFAALDSALDTLLDCDATALTTRECLNLLQRCERIRRRLPAVEHPLVNRVVDAATEQPGEKPPWLLSETLRISRAAARRRIAEAADLGSCHTLTGEPLEPILPAVAAAQRHGTIGAEHITVISDFIDYLPADTDPDTRNAAEAHLTKLAGQFRPEQLAKLARRLADCLRPDGELSDEQRARRRGLTLGAQDKDGMSRINGWLTPEARATLDAALARWAAPGMCNPDDDTPVTDGTPPKETIDADRRGAAQRNHDALVALTRAMLASGQLGTHNGLPAAIIVSASLTDLCAAIDTTATRAGAPHRTTGKAHTGGGTWLPIRDLIRLAGHAHHYLRVFDGANELALYHTKRLASPAQRIVLYARDRGCTAPGCSVPGYLCQAHHIVEYTDCGDTDIANLTFACGPHHRLIRPGGHSTRRLSNGDTEWVPAPAADHGQPRINRFHHPERLLHETAPATGSHDTNAP